MKKLLALAALAAVSMSMSAQLIASPTQLQAIDGRKQAPRPVRKQRQSGLSENSPKWKRSRGAQAKSKRKRNLVTHGRRVRRKHRRARAA